MTATEGRTLGIPLTATQLETLPVHNAVLCTTERGRTFLALKIDQGTGRHNSSRWNTTDGPATTTQIAAHNPVHLLAAHPAEVVTDVPLPLDATWDGTRPAPVADTRRGDVARALLSTLGAYWCGDHMFDAPEDDGVPDCCQVARLEMARDLADVALAVLPTPPMVDDTVEAACAWSDYRKDYGVSADRSFRDLEHKAFMAGRQSALGTLDTRRVQR